MSRHITVIHHHDASWTIICQLCAHRIGDRVAPVKVMELTFLANRHLCTPAGNAHLN